MKVIKFQPLKGERVHKFAVGKKVVDRGSVKDVLTP